MAGFVEGTSSPYTEQFRIETVDLFLELFAELGTGITRAAKMTATEQGVARSTVVDWAKSQDRMPTPTWDMLYQKDDRIAALEARVASLTRQLEKLTDQEGDNS